MWKRILPLVVLMLAGGLAARSAELAEPYRLMDGDTPISADRGHAAPFWHDMTGNGVKDLLVGQFMRGKLRLYKNRGTNEKPVFKDFEWMQADGQDMEVPAG